MHEGGVLKARRTPATPAHGRAHVEDLAGQLASLGVQRLDGRERRAAAPQQHLDLPGVGELKGGAVLLHVLHGPARGPVGKSIARSARGRGVAQSQHSPAGGRLKTCMRSLEEGQDARERVAVPEPGGAGAQQAKGDGAGPHGGRVPPRRILRERGVTGVVACARASISTPRGNGLVQGRACARRLSVRARQSPSAGHQERRQGRHDRRQDALRTHRR